MNAAKMIAACEQGQVSTGPEVTHAELVAAGAARWYSISDQQVVPSDPAVYSTWCDACACDHGSEPLIVTP